jgi:hypothetical protein
MKTNILAKYGHHAISLTICITLIMGCAALNAQTAAANVSTAPFGDVVEYAEAVNSFHNQRFAAAFGRFAHLADRGHVQSAQMAIAMLGNGSDAFNNHWSATLSQQRRWAQLVLESTNGSTAISLSPASD